MKELVKGQKIRLADLTSATSFAVGINLAFPSSRMVDVSCFGVDSNQKLSDDRYFIFYNQRTSPCGGIVAHGSYEGDTEHFSFDLSRLPQTIQRLVFTASLDGTGTMSQMSRGYIRMMVNGIEVMRYSFTGADFGSEAALIVAELYFKDVWRFGAVGQGFNGGLSALLKHYGGEEVQPYATVPVQPAPAPAPAPPRAPAPAPTPPASPAGGSINIQKITLDKKGDKQAVSLRKDGKKQPIHVNLNWDNPNAGKRKGLFGLGGKTDAPDLDLGCMFRLKDGSGNVIQPLGGYFGARDELPYIYLDKDDRSGAATDGENLYILRPDLLDFLLVFALFYEGTDDFTAVNGRMTIKDQDGNEIFIRLNNPSPNLRFCAICTIRNLGDRVEITKEEHYFQGHRFADQHYGLGFRWTAGSK